MIDIWERERGVKYDATAGAPLEGWRGGGRSMVRERALLWEGGRRNTITHPLSLSLSPPSPTTTQLTTVTPTQTDPRRCNLARPLTMPGLAFQLLILLSPAVLSATINPSPCRIRTAALKTYRSARKYLTDPARSCAISFLSPQARNNIIT